MMTIQLQFKPSETSDTTAAAFLAMRASAGRAKCIRQRFYIPTPSGPDINTVYNPSTEKCVVRIKIQLIHNDQTSARLSFQKRGIRWSTSTAKGSYQDKHCQAFSIQIIIPIKSQKISVELRKFNSQLIERALRAAAKWQLKIAVRKWLDLAAT